MPLLAGVSVLTTLVFLLARRFAVNGEALRRAKDQAQAALLEVRIFGDEPRVVGRALLRVVGANLRAAVLMLPVIALMLPFGCLAFAYLQARFGVAPLEPGVAAVVTVQTDGSVARDAVAPRLEAPAGFRVDGPPVRVVADGQIVWRIRAVEPGRGALRFLWPGVEITKTIQAGQARGPVSVRRSRDWTGWAAEPLEARLPAGPARWVEVGYAEATVRALGLDLPWEVWFLAISVAAWLALRQVPGLRDPI